MRSKDFLFAFCLCAIVACILLLAEVISFQINQSRGVDLPFFFGSVVSTRSFRGGDRFSALDPHLGYARGDGEPAVETFRTRYAWCDGFATYSTEPLDQLDRPLILTLGGSTTDPLSHDSSWPEELAKLLLERGRVATVINGAAGGYSSSQELLKLIRDGIELHPDLVISYSGVNDRGAYGSLPHPMVHSYQRELLGNLTQSGNVSPLVPNTISLLRSLREPDGSSQLSFTLGVETKRSLGGWYSRNLSLMSAVARASDAEFLAVVQPNAYVGSYEWAADFEENGKPAQYVEALRSLYAEIEDLPAQADYVHSFVEIFDGTEGAYRQDGIHTTRKGDRIIAEHILELIAQETTLWTGG